MICAIRRLPRGSAAGSCSTPMSRPGSLQEQARELPPRRRSRGCGLAGLSSGIGAATAGAHLLHGRARNIAVGTEHPAVAGFRFEHSPTALAVIEILAGIGGHNL